MIVVIFLKAAVSSFILRKVCLKSSTVDPKSGELCHLVSFLWQGNDPLHLTPGRKNVSDLRDSFPENRA